MLATPTRQRVTVETRMTHSARAASRRARDARRQGLPRVRGSRSQQVRAAIAVSR